MSHLSGEWKCHSPAPHSLLSDENARSAEFSNGAQIRLYKIYKMLTTLKKENECVSDQAFSSSYQFAGKAGASRSLLKGTTKD